MGTGDEYEGEEEAPAVDGVGEGVAGDGGGGRGDPVPGELLPRGGGHPPGDHRHMGGGPPGQLGGVELVVQGEVVPHVDVWGGAEVDHQLLAVLIRVGVVRRVGRLRLKLLHLHISSSSLSSSLS